MIPAPILSLIIASYAPNLAQGLEYVIGDKDPALCFPVQGKDDASIRYSFGDRRALGSRCHAGIDIKADMGERVVAMSDGYVVGKNTRFTPCAGKWTGQLMIYHPQENITVNYGELNASSMSVQVGQQVPANHKIGTIGECNMLHLETYQGRVNKSARWLVPVGKTAKDVPNYCRSQFTQTKPMPLVDPTNYIQRARRCQKRGSSR